MMYTSPPVVPLSSSSPPLNIFYTVANATGATSMKCSGPAVCELLFLFFICVIFGKLLLQIQGEPLIRNVLLFTLKEIIWAPLCLFLAQNHSSQTAFYRKLPKTSQTLYPSLFRKS